MKRLRRFLSHPSTRDLDPDDPRTTILRRAIIQENPFLRKIYEEWYRRLVSCLPSTPGPVVEIGSGAGFLNEFVPGLISSDVFPFPGIRLALNGMELPFKTASLKAIVMTNTLHHLADVRRFFCEASRCVSPGGILAVVEPWVTAWSRLVYGRFHHEPFMPDREEWTFASSGPLSSANGALPWILFQRDRSLFNQAFPDWQILAVTPLMPFTYLLSGGVSMRRLAPAWAFPILRWAEDRFCRAASSAMFALIVLEKGRDS